MLYSGKRLVGLVLDVQKRHELCYTRLLPRVIEDFAAPGAVQFNPRVGKSHVQTLTGARLLKAIVKSGFRFNWACRNLALG